jgi:hypothetical protein
MKSWLELERKKHPLLLLLCDRFIYIEVLDGAIQKSKKRSVLQTLKLVTAEKPVEKPVEKSLNKIDTQTIELIDPL